jgi:hypothetical protein
VSLSQIRPQAAPVADVLELNDLLAQLARGIDRSDFDLIVSCYTTESLDEHGAFSGTGREFADYICNGKSPVSKDAEFIHHSLGQTAYEIDGDSGFGETYFIFHMFTGGRLYQGVGRYVDEFARVDGQWLISHRKVVTEWTGYVDGTRLGPLPSDHVGYRDHRDPLYDYVSRASRPPGETGSRNE